jgi:choloylglycine hydrolase
MDKICYKIVIILSFSLFIFTSVFACTEFTLKSKDGAVMVARTMEFGYNMQSTIMSSPRARVFETKAPNGKPGVSWKSKYGYIFADYFGISHPVDGMNEKGLSFGYLLFPGYAQYSTIQKGQEYKALSYEFFPDWILGNFSSVEQVKKALNNIKVFAEPQSIENHKNVIFPLHAIITDALGKSIVVEFMKGKIYIYDDSQGVLTNSPPFNWQVTNLKNYINLSPYTNAPITINGITYAVAGQGSGMFGLPGDWTPPSRFVKMAILTAAALPVKDAQSALILAQHIMDTVDIAKGVVRSEKGQGDVVELTQWTVFKDLKNHVLYFKTYDNTTLQSVAMNEVDFSPSAKQIRILMASPPMIVNALKSVRLQ